MFFFETRCICLIHLSISFYYHDNKKIKHLHKYVFVFLLSVVALQVRNSNLSREQSSNETKLHYSKIILLTIVKK